MKKNKVMITMIGIIFLGSVVFGIGFWLLFSKDSQIVLRRKIIANCNSLQGRWDLGYLKIDENSKKVKMEFQLIIIKDKSRVDEDNFSLTADVCEEISDYLFSSEFHFREEGYQLDFCFSDDQLFLLEVNDVEPDMKNIYLKLPYRNYFSAIRYSDWYPQTEILDVYTIDDETMKQLNTLLI